jgi:glycosyltransferase involved in cell wall biosynthesis
MKMLFFHRGPHSGSVEALLSAWRSASPQVDVANFDLKAAMLDGPLGALRSAPRALWRGGLGVLRRGRGAFIESLNHSFWLSTGMTRQARRTQNKHDADCSFAMGTTYDACLPGRPHFIHTDITILANLYYPGGEEVVHRWKRWLPYEIDAIRRATAVFTRSEHITRSMREQYGLPPEKIVCVKAGFNITPLPNPDPCRFERRNIVFVGIDWERKGGPELVEAFSRARQRFPDATLTVVGCDPGIRRPGVHVAGLVPRQQVPDYLSKASIFCMPSRREPFGFAYLEGLAAGLPVVATNLGAAPDFIIDGQTGYQIGVGDVDALASRLEELLADPEKCRQMGERGRNLVATEYNWESTQRRMYKAICERLQGTNTQRSSSNGRQKA